MRQLDPRWALRDLSVALLLSSSSSHLTASIHLYRALVYVKLHWCVLVIPLNFLTTMRYSIHIIQRYREKKQKKGTEKL